MKMPVKCLVAAALLVFCAACASKGTLANALSSEKLDKELTSRLAEFMKDNPPADKAGEEVMPLWDPNVAMQKLDKPLKERLSAILKDLGTVKPGMTRGELLKVLEGQGGLSCRTDRAYVYPTCPYLKVDVNFVPVGELSAEKNESAADTIKEVSKPYLQWLCID